ncbi:MAG TPA: hypothetical protein VG722_13445 [Tepidisphaeraceae bacterium]|nr:hypothetical protein [Tepidisphaeraceae bacterium]
MNRARRNCIFAEIRTKLGLAFAGFTVMAGAHGSGRSRGENCSFIPFVAAATVQFASVLLASVSPASAQYVFDPNNADEQSGGIKYFGSAKDDQGALLSGVTVRIGLELVLVTDEQGRYRGSVDPMYGPDETATGCSKPGYQFVRITERPGPPGAARQTVEANCVLRKLQ